MDIIWITLGSIFLLSGLLGCFLPILPGPPLAYLSLILLQVTEHKPFSSKFLIIWASIVLVITVLDYLIPPYATKKMGGGPKGVVGSSIGIIVGIFLFPPIGIIIFPFLGAWIGEIISGKSSKIAFRAATGSFLGFIGGVFLKLVVTAFIAFYFITALIV